MIYCIKYKNPQSDAFFSLHYIKGEKPIWAKREIDLYLENLRDENCKLISISKMVNGKFIEVKNDEI